MSGAKLAAFRKLTVVGGGKWADIGIMRQGSWECYQRGKHRCCGGWNKGHLAQPRSWALQEKGGLPGGGEF